MPAKYQPDHSYLRHVRINRVHMFTFLQIICLAVLWVIKMVKAVSIIFPIMVSINRCNAYNTQYIDSIYLPSYSNDVSCRALDYLDVESCLYCNPYYGKY